MDRKWWTLIAVCIGTFMLLLDVTIVNVALPSIQASLHASFSDLQWVIDAYALMLAALLLTTGALADLFGRRLIFMLGLIVFSLSSLLSGVASDPLWLNLARGAQGVGGAAMFSTSLALLGTAFQGRERGVAFGVWGAITGLAVAIGPVIGGALTTGLSWRWIFLVNVPIGVIALVLCVLRVDESRQHGARRPDLLGALTFSGALAALIYALIKGNSKGWGSSTILGCLIGAGVLMILFVILELVQGEKAMFDLKLFRKPTFTGGLIAAFALSGGLFALFLYFTLYLQDVLGYSALETGLRFLVLSGGILLTSTLAGRLTAHVPIRFLIAPGLVMVGVGLLLMRGLTASSGWTHLIPGFIVAGAGTGLINPPLASTAIGVVPPARSGMASGINSTFRQIGIATGIAGLGSIFSHSVRTKIVALLSSTHVSAHTAQTLAAGVAQGSGAKGALGSLPPAARATAAHAVRIAFVGGLNEIFLIGAILSLVGGALTLVLIRSKDFEEGSARSPAGGGPGASQPETAVPPETAAAPAAATEAAPERPPAPEPTEAPVEPRPAAAAPIPTAPIPTGTRGDGRPRTAGLIAAAELAARYYTNRTELEIERMRSTELAEAEAQAVRLREAAEARADEFAALLRQREGELAAERDRIITELRRHNEAVSEHTEHAAEARDALYRLIGRMTPGDSPAADSPAADSPAGDSPAAGNGAPPERGGSDGNGAHDGQGQADGTQAPDYSGERH